MNPLEGTASDIPNYEANGRRDPFEVYEVREGGGGLSVSSTRLTGIVRNSRSALALVEAPDGIGYILRPGDTLGDGKLMDIGLDNAKRIANQYRPFVVEEVCDRLLQQPGHDPVEWYRSLRGV